METQTVTSTSGEAPRGDIDCIAKGVKDLDIGKDNVSDGLFKNAWRRSD